MALTLLEWLGNTNKFTAVGVATGGAVKAIIPPSTVYDAGPLALTRWFLDQLYAAQAADAGTPEPRPTVVRRTSTEQNGFLITTYTVILKTTVASISQDAAINVEDDFN